MLLPAMFLLMPRDVAIIRGAVQVGPDLSGRNGKHQGSSLSLL